jgi:cold shock CspA family protein
LAGTRFGGGGPPIAATSAAKQSMMISGQSALRSSSDSPGSRNQFAVHDMSAEYSYGTKRKGAPKRPGKPPRNDPRGKPATGRIARILVGQGHGFIRLRDDDKVFFHRGDLCEGTAFNDLEIGETVTFELLEDSVSGARAVRVKRKKGASASSSLDSPQSESDSASSRR